MNTHPQEALQREDSPDRGFFGFMGRLEEISLSGILTLLDMEAKSGVVSLWNPTGAGGRVFVCKGRVVRAFFDGIGKPENFEAVQAMLRWTHGSFEFHAREVKFEDQVARSTASLLLEAACRHDETARERPRFSLITPPHPPA